MKKLISLLMTLVMLTGTCVAFAEAEAVDHQAALEALLAEAGVELQPGDLSRPFEKAMGNTVMQLVLTHTKLTEEQLTEWETVKSAVREETEALKTEDAEQSVRIFNEAIDGMKSITPFTKSMLKRVIFDGMYQRSAVTEKERQMIQAIYNALEAELHGADEARTGEIVAGVKEAMEGLVGLHNVRDDMMFLLKFLQEKGLSPQNGDDALLARLAGEILTAADQFMGDRIEDLDAALEEIPAFEAEVLEGSFELWEQLVRAMEMLDEEELAETETHIMELADAVLQGDQEALGEQVKHVFDDHLMVQLDQKNYEVLLGMEDEELRALAFTLMGMAHNWQNDNLGADLPEALNAELNWSDLSEEDVATIRDAVETKIGAMELPEEVSERAIEMMIGNIIAINRFSEEEQGVADSLFDLLYRTLEEDVLDAAQLVELENEMETLLYELAGDSEKYAATPEDLAAVLENVDLEKVESLSDNAKFFLSIRFMEHFEVYSMLTEEYRAKLPEVDQALLDAIKGLEVKGQETTAEQLQVLEKAVYDVLSQLDIPVEVMAKEVAKTVSNCLFMSVLTEEEQGIVEAALEAISQTLAEGNREEIRVLRNYYHQVQHHMEEGQVKPQLQNDQA